MGWEEQLDTQFRTDSDVMADAVASIIV